MARASFILAALVALAATLIASQPNARRIAFLVGALAGRAIPAPLRPLVPFLPRLNGGGREAAAAAYVLAHSPPGNVSAAIAAFEAYATSEAWMMAVGPVKGAIVQGALAGTAAHKVLELGTYCGYGAMLLATAAASDAHIYSVEVDPEFAGVARSILAHAGLGERVTVLEGALGSHLPGLAAAPPAGPLDFVFVDHDKDAHLPDVTTLLRTPGLVREGVSNGTVFAFDNLRVPGSPTMVAWLKSRPPGALETAWHETELEFVKGIPDLVSVSRVLDVGLALGEGGAKGE